MSNISSLVRNRVCRTAVLLALAFVATGGTAAHAQDASQATQTQSTDDSGQSGTSVSSYRINPGDLLEIFVWGDERLQRELTVLPDGTIAFPLVGQLMVAERLPQEVEAMVSERLQDQYRGDVPSITVSVKATSGMRFSVLGRVQSPGTFSASRYVNVLEALSAAGGPDEFANLSSIMLIRGTGENSQVYRVRLDGIFRSSVSERTIREAGIIQMQPGDVIIVP